MTRPSNRAVVEATAFLAKYENSEMKDALAALLDRTWDDGFKGVLWNRDAVREGMMYHGWDDHERIIVCGGRDFSDYELLAATLDRLTRKFTRVVILSGGAEGADALAEKWAFSKWYSVIRFHPDYDKHGKKAPLVRNTEMAEAATRAVCFWDGRSKGTKDMIDKARRLGLKVKVIKYGGE